MKEKLLHRVRTALIQYPRDSIAAIALLLTLFLESCNRHSLVEALSFPMSNPWGFLVNLLIVAATLYLSLLVQRRMAALAVISGLWLLVGFIDFMLLFFRITPFNGQDFLLLPDAIAIAPQYVGWVGVIGIILGLIGLLAGMVVMFRRGRRYDRDLRRSGAFCLATLVILVLAVTMGLRSGALSPYFGNMGRAYEENGFVYCFGCTLFVHGVAEPEKYDPDEVENLVGEITEPQVPPEEAGTDGEGLRPDIIVVQMESFFDPAYMLGTTYSEDPIPVFRRLKENCPSGWFSAPSIGAGTINTEFEVLTGMDLEFFGPGEYPYSTVLQDRTVESAAYVLGELGYTSHAMHNNTGSFYSRYKVYPNLGFDSFTSLEYMAEPRYNAMGWADDSLLTDSILDCLNSTAGRDFVFAVSVQSHGKYPEQFPEGAEDTIRTTWEGENRNLEGWRYYVNQLREQDEFLGELIAALRERGKPVMLVVYGDHLPNFPLEEGDLYGGDLYRTEYVIWNNFDLQAENRDLEASQLMARALELLGIREGTMFRAHQTLAQQPDYRQYLQLLQYDLLEGDMIAWNGVNPWAPADMRMGVREIAVTGVQEYQQELYVLGENFTPASRVLVNGDAEETVYISSTVLLMPDCRPNPGSTVAVEQVSQKGFALSETAPYTIP